MKARPIIDRFLGYFLAIIMGIMVINVLWQVFSRYFLAEPSTFTDELARYLMIWIGILGAAYVSGRNGHVAIDVVPSRLSKKSQKKLSIAVRVFIILFAFFAMVVGGLRLVYITYVLQQFSPALGVPLALVYSIIPLSGVLIIYFKLSDMIEL